MVENTDLAIAKACKMTHAEKIIPWPPFSWSIEKKELMNGWLNLKRLQNAFTLSKNIRRHLTNLNSDYEAKRHNNTTLNPLIINVARENLFYEWLKDRDKLGGQHKIPRLSNQRDYLEQLKEMQSKIIL
jgi:hypothetical protein